MVSIDVPFWYIYTFLFEIEYVSRSKVTVKRFKGSAVVVSEVINGETGKLLHRKTVTLK